MCTFLKFLILKVTDAYYTWKINIIFYSGHMRHNLGDGSTETKLGQVGWFYMLTLFGWFDVKFLCRAPSEDWIQYSVVMAQQTRLATIIPCRCAAESKLWFGS